MPCDGRADTDLGDLSGDPHQDRPGAARRRLEDDRGSAATRPNMPDATTAPAVPAKPAVLTPEVDLAKIADADAA